MPKQVMRVSLEEKKLLELLRDNQSLIGQIVKSLENRTMELNTILEHFEDIEDEDKEEYDIDSEIEYYSDCKEDLLKTISLIKFLE